MTITRKFAHIQQPRVELNITDLCNLRCDFCPRAHGYPNKNLHMSNEMLDLYLAGVKEYYEKHNHFLTTFLIGRGEPTLHNDFIGLVTRIYEFNEKMFEEYPELHERKTPKVGNIHTNGYKYENWIPQIGHLFNQIDFNCYSDRTHVEYLRIKEEMKQYPHICVHDRGTTGRNEPLQESRTNKHGNTTPVTYNSRAGSIPENIIPMKNLDDAKNKTCNKPFDMLYLDFDGEWRLCCNDWDDLISLGNLKDISIVKHMSNNNIFNEYRWRLANGDRSLTPCNICNASVKSDHAESDFVHTFSQIVDMNPQWIRSVKHIDLKQSLY